MGLALFVFIFVTASLANFKLSVLFLLLGAGLGDCLAPARLLGQKLFPAGVRTRQWPAVAAGRRLVRRRLVYPGKRRPPATLRA